MKIDPTARLRSTPTRRAGRSRTSSAAGAFESHMATASDSNSPVSAPPATPAMNPLLAVQEVADATSGRAQARARGDAMLDRLEDIRIGLLSGFVARERLDELLRLVNERRSKPGDSQLEAVLDEIELRAKVELAKLSMQD